MTESSILITKSARRSFYGQFYTAEAISRLLVDVMNSEGDLSILDLGCGQGQLSRSAASRWSGSTVTTVDLDTEAATGLVGGRHAHICGDALDPDLPSKLNLAQGGFDIAVCNPPYIRPRWREGFTRIIADAGLKEVCPVFRDARAEILFLAQILRLMKDGGEIGIIVPDGPVTGERCRAIREHLLNHHSVNCVIELPSGVFNGTEARTHILVIRKSAGASRRIKLMRFTESGVLTPPIFISIEEGVERMDYSFNASRRSNEEGIRRSMRELRPKLVRGGLRSSEIPSSKEFVFHTCDFPVPGSSLKVELPPLSATSHEERKGARAFPGDILVARVGRNLETKVCLVASGSALISDCVYKISVNEADSGKLLQALTSIRGRDYLRTVSRGVGARYLTQAALLNFKI